MKVKEWVEITYNIDEWRIVNKNNEFCFSCYPNFEDLNKASGNEEIKRVSIYIEDDGGLVVAEIFTK